MTAAGWPIIGRTDELAFLLDATAGGRGALIAGGAGVGKTAVAALVAERLARDGWTVSTHTATSALRTVPFAPFAALAGPTHDDQLSRMIGAVTAVQARQRALVVVEDVQWLDDVSMTFLRLLVDSTDARLVLTLRTGERRRLGAVADLWRSGVLTRVDLQPLSRGDVTKLVAAWLPGGGSSAVARSVWDLSAGNALYVRELLRASRAAGRISLVDGEWSLSSPPLDALEELLGERLAEVTSNDEQRALALLAVADELGLTLLEELSSAEAVASLERLGLVTMTESARRVEVRLAHPIYVELVRSSLGVVGVRAVRSEVLAALTSKGLRRAGDDVRAAVWRVELGDYGDPERLLDAARDLAGGYSWAQTNLGAPMTPAVPAALATATTLATAAFDGGAGFEAAALLVELHGAQGRAASAVQFLDHMEQLTVNDGQRVRAARLRAVVAVLDGADARTANEILDHAASMVSDPIHLRTIDATRAFVAWSVHDVPSAIEVTRAILDDPATRRSERAQALMTAAGALTTVGRSVDAATLLDEQLPILAESPPDAEDGIVLIARIVVLCDLGLLREAHDLCTEALRVTEVIGWDEGTGFLSMALAQVALMAGDGGRCVELASGGMLLTPLDRFGQHRVALSLLAHALAVTRDATDDDIASALARMEDAPIRTRLFAVTEVRARAAFAARRGAMSEARTIIEAAVAEADGQGRRTQVSMLLHDLVRYGFASAGTQLDRVASTCQGDLAAARAEHGRAAAAHDGVALDAAADRFEALGTVLYAAETSAQAAREHAAAALHARAQASARRATALADACGATTPALHDLPDSATHLTTREREVAGLAASGLSDRVIAAHLSLSARTVQSHLYAAYAKLGVAGRDELSGALDAS